MRRETGRRLRGRGGGAPGHEESPDLVARGVFFVMLTGFVSYPVLLNRKLQMLMETERKHAGCKTSPVCLPSRSGKSEAGGRSVGAVVPRLRLLGHLPGISRAPKHSPHASDQTGLPESSAEYLRLQDKLCPCASHLQAPPVSLRGVGSWGSRVFGGQHS